MFFCQDYLYHITYTPWGYGKKHTHGGYKLIKTNSANICAFYIDKLIQMNYNS